MAAAIHGLRCKDCDSTCVSRRIVRSVGIRSTGVAENVIDSEVLHSPAMSGGFDCESRCSSKNASLLGFNTSIRVSWFLVPILKAMPDLTGGVPEQERNDYWLTDPQSCSDAQPACFPPKCMGDTGVLQKAWENKADHATGRTEDRQLRRLPRRRDQEDVHKKENEDDREANQRKDETNDHDPVAVGPICATKDESVQ